MPVLTRNMRKNADLPDLPAQFPVAVPNIRARPRPSKSSRPNETQAVVPRSSLRIASPVVLSSPARLDAPSPLTPSASRDSFSTQRSPLTPSASRKSFSSQQSRSSSSSIASAPTQYDPPFTGVPRGVRKLSDIRLDDGKWNLEEHHETVRMCPPLPPRLEDPRVTQPRRPALFNEWSFLSESGSGTKSANGSRAGSESVSSEATHGTPSVSSSPSTFAGRPEREEPRVRRQPGPGVSKR
ncbi:hypothetical protein B0H12DRAFT_1131250 [Mycena haematopus]|nr:hypothetical protein B0H12DRAFT_1131250 [Mycena haematopus]